MDSNDMRRWYGLPVAQTLVSWSDSSAEIRLERGRRRSSRTWDANRYGYGLTVCLSTSDRWRERRFFDRAAHTGGRRSTPYLPGVCVCGPSHGRCLVAPHSTRRVSWRLRPGKYLRVACATALRTCPIRLLCMLSTKSTSGLMSHVVGLPIAIS